MLPKIYYDVNSNSVDSKLSHSVILLVSRNMHIWLRPLVKFSKGTVYSENLLNRMYSGFHELYVGHNSDVTGAPCRLKSSATLICFNRLFCQAKKSNNNEKKIKVPHYWSIVIGIRQSTVDSHHNGPVMPKIFPYHDVITKPYFHTTVMNLTVKGHTMKY